MLLNLYFQVCFNLKVILYLAKTTQNNVTDDFQLFPSFLSKFRALAKSRGALSCHVKHAAVYACFSAHSKISSFLMPSNGKWFSSLLQD